MVHTAQTQIGYLQNNQMTIHNLISKRKSIRAFSEQPIDDETLASLFEAARWAPSSANEQPWRFILAKKEDKEAFVKMQDCLLEGNKIWAKGAAALFITIAKKNFDFNNKANIYSWHDVGLATAMLSVQATELNLYLHQMGGFDHAKAKEVFAIPDDYEAVSIIAVGYEGNPELLPENLRAREVGERKRKPLSELVFSSQFGKENDLFKTTTNN
ncbi:MAG: nitroreductase family protein [Bacteroidetes bacterium]|nr:nitroreductase family protein [Bacteroidota bacterium]